MKKILVVDYDPKIISRFTDLLSGEGFTVESAQDGSTALTKFDEFEPDLVVLAAMLPKMHGFEVCQKIRSHPKGARVPVIINTGVYRGRKYRDQALHKYRANEYLERPFPDEKLLDAVNKALGGEIAPLEPPKIKEKPTPPPTESKSEKSGEETPEKPAAAEEVIEPAGKEEPPPVEEPETTPEVKDEPVKHVKKEDKKPAERNSEPPKKISDEKPEKGSEEKRKKPSIDLGELENAGKVKKGPARKQRSDVNDTLAGINEMASRKKPDGSAMDDKDLLEKMKQRGMEPPPPDEEPEEKAEAKKKKKDTVTSADLFGDLLDEVGEKKSAARKESAKKRTEKARKSKEDINRKLEETLSGILGRPGKAKVKKEEKPPEPPAGPEMVEEKPEPPSEEDVKEEADGKVQEELSEEAELDITEEPEQVEEIDLEGEEPLDSELEPVETEATAEEETLQEEPEELLDAEEPAGEDEDGKRKFAAEEIGEIEEGKEVDFGQYKLLKRIATGGMAELFLARQRGVEGFQKLVAIKKILPHLSEHEDFVNMFIDEAKVAAQLNHQNIAQIYDLGVINGAYYIAMEYVHGKDVRGIIKKQNGPMPLQYALYIVTRICSALDYAHRKKDFDKKDLELVHRDVSPQNFLVSYEGEVKLVDFGIAKAASMASHTHHGALKGKILFMSPEQAYGKEIDRRSDIFSLGASIFEMLTGEHLFTGGSEMEILEQVRSAAVRSPSSVNSDVDPELDSIVLKALSKYPDDRYQNAAELSEDLENFALRSGMIVKPASLAGFLKDLFPEEDTQIPFRKAEAGEAEETVEPAVEMEEEPAAVEEEVILGEESAGAEEKPVLEEEPESVIEKEPRAEEKPEEEEAESIIEDKPQAEEEPETGEAERERIEETEDKVVAESEEPEPAVEAEPEDSIEEEEEPEESRETLESYVEKGEEEAKEDFILPEKEETVASLSAGKKSKTPMIIGVVVVLAVVAAVAFFLLSGGEEESGAETVAAVADESGGGTEEKREPKAPVVPVEEKQETAETVRREDTRESRPVRQPAVEPEEAERPERTASKKETPPAEPEPVKTARLEEPEKKPLQPEPEPRPEVKPVEIKEIKRGDLVELTPDVLKPVPLNKVSPNYPRSAKRMKIEGMVFLSVLIDENGRVQDVKVIRAPKNGDELAKAATEAVKKWEFSPAIKHGKEVKVWITVPIPFKL